MKPIPLIWQKRLSWVPYFNWIFIFVRMFRSLKVTPTWWAGFKAYLLECGLLVLSNTALALPRYLLGLLIPQAKLYLVLLHAWLLAVIYVRASIWVQEHPGWRWF